jgi:hypothetical protein
MPYILNHLHNVQPLQNDKKIAVAAVLPSKNRAKQRTP